MVRVGVVERISRGIWYIQREIQRLNWNLTGQQKLYDYDVHFDELASKWQERREGGVPAVIPTSHLRLLNSHCRRGSILLI